jgi:hypothetical protein
MLVVPALLGNIAVFILDIAESGNQSDLLFLPLFGFDFNASCTTATAVCSAYAFAIKFLGTAIIFPAICSNPGMGTSIMSSGKSSSVTTCTSAALEAGTGVVMGLSAFISVGTRMISSLTLRVRDRGTALRWGAFKGRPGMGTRRYTVSLLLLLRGDEGAEAVVIVGAVDVLMLSMGVSIMYW